MKKKVTFFFKKMNFDQNKQENNEEEEIFEKPFIEYDVVTIISSDNEYFVIPTHTAKQCKFFDAVLKPGSLFKESCEREIQLDYNSQICNEIIRFLFHKEQKRPKDEFVVPEDLILDLYSISDFIGL